MAASKADRARQALEAARAAANSAPEEETLMYRGQRIRRSGVSGTPGAPRGANPGRRSEGGEAGDMRSQLAKLKMLYEEGLISHSDYEAKKSQIIDRL